MKECPVCHKPVRYLGIAACPDSEEPGGLIVNVTGRTYVVHVCCLKAFEARAERGELECDES